MKDNLPLVTPKSPAGWEEWLEKHHETSEGAWLQIFKKDSGKANLTYQEAVVVALCFGWIDGVRYKHDDVSFVQRFTPRRPQSPWSKINVEHVGRLLKEGRIRPFGLAHIEAAKKDGRWDRAYDSQKTAEVPADFLKELKKDKKAFAFFESLNKVNKYAISYRLHSAKKPETREKRFKLFLQMMKEGKKFH